MKKVQTKYRGLLDYLAVVCMHVLLLSMLAAILLDFNNTFS